MIQTILATILCAIFVIVFEVYAVFGAEIVNDPLKLRTPKGIIITISQKAIIQYEQYWGIPWEEIEWDRIDDFYQGWMDQLGIYVNPKNIKVNIRPWNPACVDEDTYASREMMGCIDGALTYNTIHMHLGDESATGWLRIQTNGDGSAIDNEFTQWWSNKSWCNTALGHEMYHLMTGRYSNWNMPQNPTGLCE